MSRTQTKSKQSPNPDPLNPNSFPYDPQSLREYALDVACDVVARRSPLPHREDDETIATYESAKKRLAAQALNVVAIEQLSAVVEMNAEQRELLEIVRHEWRTSRTNVISLHRSACKIADAYLLAHGDLPDHPEVRRVADAFMARVAGLDNAGVEAVMAEFEAMT